MQSVWIVLTVIGLKKNQRSTHRFRPSLERLETRLPFDASGLAIDVDFGDVHEGLAADEITLVGGTGTQIADASTVALPDGSHYFLWIQDHGTYADIYARQTLADGSPGAQPTLLIRQTLGQTVGIEDVRFDATMNAAGELAVIWSDGLSVFGQRFGQGLLPSGNAVTLVTHTSGQFPIELAVRGLEDGRLAVTYTDPDTEHVTLSIRDALFAPTNHEWTEPSGPPDGPTIDLALAELESEVVRLNWISYDPLSPTEWTIHTAVMHPDHSVTTTTYIATDMSSPPQLEYLSNGAIVLAGTRTVAGGHEAYVQLFEHDWTFFSEFVVNDTVNIQQDLAELAVLEDDMFVVGFIDNSMGEAALQLQVYSSDGDRIGSATTVNQSPLHTDLMGGVFGLDSGGLAGYWLGYALDQVSPAVFTRTLQLESTEFEIQIVGDQGQVDFSNDYLLISGISEDVGLNVGTRLSDQLWQVPLSQLSELRILNMPERESLSFSVHLFDHSENSIVATSTPTFGSEDDDILSGLGLIDRIDGRDGYDRVEFLRELDAFEFELISEDDYRVTDGAAVDVLMSNIEEFCFGSSSYTLSELLDVVANQEASETDSVPSIPSGPPGPGGPPGTPVGPPPGPGQPPPLIPGPSSPPPGNSIPPAAGEVLGPRQPIASKPPTGRNNQGDPASESGRGLGQSQVASDGLAAPMVSASLTSFPDLHVSANPSQLTSFQQVGTAESTFGSPETLTQVESDALSTSVVSAIPGHTGGIETSVASSLAIELGNDLQESRIGTEFNSAQAIPGGAMLTSYRSVAAPAFDSAQLFASIDAVEEQAIQDQQTAQIVVGSAVVVATGFSVAHIAWLLRSSVLMTKLLSGMPIWISFDPLPLLRDCQPVGLPQGSNESLVDIVSNQS